MHLKNLTLKGFKSFAEQASIDLEPGVTVVVGPNGSGKSNVVDAIAWVLGAQAPSAVRSQKMDDVIFAGTTSKPALGRAEVSLTIDNSSGSLPVEFNEVKLTRTLFRTGESEYAINGVPCRLLDVTELLSDGGVGRQQHVIVSQGQIDAVLNARPEDRRAIIEEAAGVLKYRKRKDRAERRLSSTDTDLTRVKDLMREVRRQLRPLEKQAEAARRHGDLIEELNLLRVHVAGVEISDLRSRLKEVSAAKAAAHDDVKSTREQLDRISAEIVESEHRLSNQGGHDLGDTLVRLESLRERCRGLSALLVERGRGVERERSAFTDRAVIANLESQAARCREESNEVEQQLALLEPEMQGLADSESQLQRDRQQFTIEWGDGVPVPSGRASESRGELGALTESSERGQAELQSLDARMSALADRRRVLEADAAERRAEAQAMRDEEEPLVSAHEAAEIRHADADAVHTLAVDQLSDLRSELDRWSARKDALGLALDEARARSGAEHLDGIDGVLGTLLDLVSVDQGWEAAFESAAGDALGVVVVSDREAALSALALLSRGDGAGAVLALGSVGSAHTSESGDRIRDHVRGTHPGVDELLDTLLANVVVVSGDWRSAADLSITQPQATVVTLDGDRFSPSGWRIGGGATGATGAALAEAEANVDSTTIRCAEAEAKLSECAVALASAETRVTDLAAKLNQIASGLAATADALVKSESDRREITAETEALRPGLEELTQRVAREVRRISELEAELPSLESAESDILESGRRLAVARTEIERRAMSTGSLRTDLEVRAAGLRERASSLTRRLNEIESRLERDAVEREAATDQRISLDRRAAVVEALSNSVRVRAARIDARLAVVREERRLQSEAVQSISNRLDSLRSNRTEADRRLEGLRSLEAHSEVEEAQLRTTLQAVVDRLRSEHGIAPDVAVSAACPPLDAELLPGRRIEMLESELDIMGPVNPLALEEFSALHERHTFLQGQLDDIRSTRRELSRVIKSIDEEIVTVFASAFADVAVNFTQLFETLFPGGVGSLQLTTPDDLLNTGIEISAKPSGKNVKKLSLLSGGERSLTALAFLFAVFRSRPSPFYVMDEVEAALDDVNLHRFLSLVEEFRADAQLLLVSHQKRTMEAADCLYGVTMKSAGSSRVVSERVAAA